MSTSKICIQTKTTLEEIKLLKLSFEKSYTLAVSSGLETDIIEARKLKVELEVKIKTLHNVIKKEWQRFDRYGLVGAEHKQNYRIIETIPHFVNNDKEKKDRVSILQVLPNDRIVSGTRSGTIRIWKKDNKEK